MFISPERLQIKDFRDRLMVAAAKRPIARVVVDEAHCVSEWGHDVRPAYLNLGRIAAHYCGRNGDRPPLAALTGTASERVLRDIQRELGVEGDETIVRPSKFGREELKFEIVRVPLGEKAEGVARLIGKVISEKLGVAPEVLASGACGGIVFCPHVNGKLGVSDTADNLSRRLPQFGPGGSPGSDPDHAVVGLYSGDPPKRLTMSEEQWTNRKAKTQRAFKSGQLLLLVATSAFGMGIDKPNIRDTVHYAMAPSVEAFAQEAGRAGRDGKDAVCAVLFTDHRDQTRSVHTLPADCLDPTITVEEAQRRAAAAGWNRDDAELRIYLHSTAYQGRRRESAAIRAFYHAWIEPRLRSPTDRAGHRVEVVVEEREYHARIEDLMLPLWPEGAVEEGVADEGTGGSRPPPTPELQRLIYRLSLLGIIDDSTVAHKPGQNVYELAVREMDEQAIKDRLVAYVGRYRTEGLMGPVRAQLDASLPQDAVGRCVDTLCWFVYEQIEKQRRQAISTMRGMLRDSADGADLAHKIDDYLSFTTLTQSVFSLLRSDDYREWGRVADEITAAGSARYVYSQCLRTLDDSPDHPGLRLLAGLALQGSAGSRQDDVVGTFGYGLRQVREVFGQSDQRAIAEWAVRELARIAPNAAPSVLNQVVRRDLDTVVSGAVLRSVDAGSLQADPILPRTSQRCLLQSLDDRLTAFVRG